MKKFLLTLVALMAIAVTADAQTVYISSGSGAVAYHKSKDCSYLTKSKDVKSVSTSEAKNMGRHACARCFGSAAASSTKKEVTKKETVTKNSPARDEKGRFIKKADTEKKTTEKKVKETKTTAEKKTTEAKKSTPARDEKGRFIKKAA